MKRVIVFVCIVAMIVGMTSVAFAGGGREADPSDGIRVAYQIGYDGSTYRELGIVEFEDAAQRYKDEGIIDDFTVYRNVVGRDVAEQISQIRDIISLGYDVIVVNPNSDTALNGVYEEAVEAGLTVMVLAIPSHPDVWGVMGDNYGDYNDFGNWVAEATGGEGRAMHIYGIDGSPNNRLRMAGVHDALAGTNIDIVAEQSGGWSVPQAKEIASGLLAAHPNVGIVLTHDPMDEGVFSAYRDAGRVPEYAFVTLARPSFQYIRDWWAEGHDVQIYGPKSHAGLPQAALYVGMKIHMGGTLRSDMISGDLNNSVVIPNPGPVATNDNFDEFWDVLKDMPDDWLWAFTVDESEVDTWFE